MSAKPTVMYKDIQGVVVGRPCYVLSINHPSPYVTGGDVWAVTSNVLSHDRNSGKVETLNTIYVPESETEQMISGLLQEPRGFSESRMFVQALALNAKVTLSADKSKVYVYPVSGGLIACPVEHVDGDIAPWCD